MVTSISNIGSTQATYAARNVTQAAPATTAAENTPAATTQDAAPGAPGTAAPSAESAAAARLGEQLNAQADATRVQRAVDDSAVASAEATGAGSGGDTQAATPAAGGAQAPMAAGAGGASSSSRSTDADYIAEADTNSDQTVSDQERAVYEAKQRQQAEEAAQARQAGANDPDAARTAEVRAAYGLDQNAAPALEITA